MAIYGGARISRRVVAWLARPASQALMPKLRTAKRSEIQSVLELIHYYNAGLEQEALLL